LIELRRFCSQNALACTYVTRRVTKKIRTHVTNHPLCVSINMKTCCSKVTGVIIERVWKWIWISCLLAATVYSAGSYKVCIYNQMRDKGWATIWVDCGTRFWNKGDLYLIAALEELTTIYS
jgi:hypothetical protein